MAQQADRTVGGAFTARERELLDLLCAGDAPQHDLARAQLRDARWGGYELDACECFLIAVDAAGGSTRIRHGGGPFASLVVSRAGEAVGLLDLWVVDGVLHSVNFMPYGDDHDELPDPHTCVLTPVD